MNKNEQAQFDELQAENAKLKQDLQAATEGTLVASLQSENVELKTALEQARTELAASLENVQQLEKDAEVLIAQRNDAIKTANEAEDKVEELEETIAALSSAGDATTPGAKHQFTFEEGSYTILVPKVSIPKIGALTAEQITGNSEAQAWLVNNNSPFIQKNG